MKTLTYGTLPSREDLQTAWNADETIADDSGFEISILTTGADYDHLTMFGDRPLLDTDADWALSYQSGNTGKRWTFLLSFDHLLRLLNDLVSDFNNERHLNAEHAEWAGDFASSILHTLGFEWV